MWGLVAGGDGEGNGVAAALVAQAITRDARRRLGEGLHIDALATGFREIIGDDGALANLSPELLQVALCQTPRIDPERLWAAIELPGVDALVAIDARERREAEPAGHRARLSRDWLERWITAPERDSRDLFLFVQFATGGHVRGLERLNPPLTVQFLAGEVGAHDLGPLPLPRAEPLLNFVSIPQFSCPAEFDAALTAAVRYGTVLGLHADAR
jgi:hypothetical protein